MPFTPSSPDFVFGSIQVASDRSGLISLVVVGSFVWFCGLGHWVYLPLSLFQSASIAKLVHVFFGCLVWPRATCC